MAFNHFIYSLYIFLIVLVCLFVFNISIFPLRFRHASSCSFPVTSESQGIIWKCAVSSTTRLTAPVQTQLLTLFATCSSIMGSSSSVQEGLISYFPDHSIYRNTILWVKGYIHLKQILVVMERICEKTKYKEVLRYIILHMCILTASEPIMAFIQGLFLLMLSLRGFSHAWARKKKKKKKGRSKSCMISS